MIYVVGSGPAGVSCAMALLHKGVDVTLLDPGLELDSNRLHQLGRLRDLGPEKWQAADLAFLKEKTSAGLAGIPLKYAYGSDYSYRDPGVDWRLQMNGVETAASFARGGLSTVWGAAILPYRENDIRDWPIGIDELASHYRAVLGFMPLSACRDSLESLFPLHTEITQSAELSGQAKDLLKDLNAASEQLKRQNVYYGMSRLAIWASSNHHKFGCCYCGQCMYGCPYNAIYSSSHTLELLREHPRFTYRKNVAVDRLIENADQVTLVAHDTSARGQLRFQGSRAFLGCGVLATTKILLDSLEAFNRTLILQDSCYFLLPLFRFRPTSAVTRARLHTLAQIFLEILDPAVCDQTVHLQVYGYNDLYSLALKRLFGPAFCLLRIPGDALLNRLFIIQGYLPSSYSPSISAVLCKDSNSGLRTLRLAPISNDLTAPTLKNVVRKLKNNRNLLRAIPVEAMLRPGKPGRSFHSGGTFPMHASPGWFQSDQYGRPYGFKRVHAVDSTVFPSIPATTITLSVMANAHRIGSGIGEY